MIITELYVRNFGKLSDRHFYLENGENPPKESVTVKDMLKRSNIDAFKINDRFKTFEKYSFEIIFPSNRFFLQRHSIYQASCRNAWGHS